MSAYIATPVRLFGAVEYGLTGVSKVVIETGFRWREANEVDDSGLAALIPSLRWIRIKPLWLTGFDTFASAGYDLTLLDTTVVSDDGSVLRSGHTYIVPRKMEHVVSRRRVNLGVGAGLLRRLKTDRWVFTPYLGLHYTLSWEMLNYQERALEAEDESNLLGDAGIQAGFEMEITPSLSLRSGVLFSLQNTDTRFRIGLNYHRSNTVDKERKQTDK